MASDEEQSIPQLVQRPSPLKEEQVDKRIEGDMEKKATDEDLILEETTELDQVDQLWDGCKPYLRKAHLLNNVMQDHIGMGKFQWQVFGLCAMGWLLGTFSFHFVLQRARPTTAWTGEYHLTCFWVFNM